MDANGRARSSIWTPLFFSIVLVVGMILGFNLRDSLRNKRDIATFVQRNDRLEDIIDLIRENYVDTINTNNLYEEAVNGILNPLDPHTVSIPSDELQDVNNSLDGSFSGIGVEFSILRDTIEITSVVENGPAARAGLATGDQIIRVEDSLVAGTGITSEGIMQLLRGRRNSRVSVTIKKGGSDISRLATITRDIVPIYSVDASIMLNDSTGYIKINRFAATTYKEFHRALARLSQQGARQLVLDLRDNPGGYLDAATSILDDFLDAGKLILFTEGQHTPRTDYKTGDGGDFEQGRLAVLVDENSASASEILAGAIQDWDRGLIVGRRTFGKGLVQEQYEMPDGSALRLTTARYYTPSGRSIQRSFADGREAYDDDLENRLESGELTGTPKTTPADTTPYYTAAKRIVYGGGGIAPDVYVPYDTTHWSTPLLNLAFSTEMKTAIWDYFISHRSKLRFHDIQDFIHTFKGEGQVINSYVAMLPPGERTAVLKHVSNPESSTYFGTQIKAQLARYLFRDNGYYSVKLRDDKMVNKALDLLASPDYNRLLSHG